MPEVPKYPVLGRFRLIERSTTWSSSSSSSNSSRIVTTLSRDLINSSIIISAFSRIVDSVRPTERNTVSARPAKPYKTLHKFSIANFATLTFDCRRFSRTLKQTFTLGFLFVCCCCCLFVLVLFRWFYGRFSKPLYWTSLNSTRSARLSRSPANTIWMTQSKPTQLPIGGMAESNRRQKAHTIHAPLPSDERSVKESDLISSSRLLEAEGQLSIFNGLSTAGATSLSE